MNTAKLIPYLEVFSIPKWWASVTVASNIGTFFFLFGSVSKLLPFHNVVSRDNSKSTQEK
jgi:hypothetical protein